MAAQLGFRRDQFLKTMQQKSSIRLQVHGADLRPLQNVKQRKLRLVLLGERNGIGRSRQGVLTEIRCEKNLVKFSQVFRVVEDIWPNGQDRAMCPIGRDALLHFLREHGEVALRVAEQLSHNSYSAYEEFRTLGLPSEKFAKLLLSWSDNAGHSTDASHIKLTLTHEEIAEMIGTSRETVSRLFSEFKRKQLLQMKGSTLIIRNKPALERMVHT